jgi:Domain of unknown function (DUF4296)
MKNYLFIFIILSTLFACGNKYTPVPSNLIQPEKFTNILMDIRLAEANQKLMQQQGYRAENLLDSSYYLVYKIHGVDASKVKDSYDFYVLHTEWMSKITDDIIDKLNHMEP